MTGGLYLLYQKRLKTKALITSFYSVFVWKSRLAAKRDKRRHLFNSESLSKLTHYRYIAGRSVQHGSYLARPNRST